MSSLLDTVDSITYNIIIKLLLLWNWFFLDRSCPLMIGKQITHECKCQTLKSNDKGPNVWTPSNRDKCEQDEGLTKHYVKMFMSTFAWHVTQNVKTQGVQCDNHFLAVSSLLQWVCLRAALLPAVVHTQFIPSDPKHAAAAGAKQHWRSCDEQRRDGN